MSMTHKYTQKYTVVCFFTPQKRSIDFAASDWPLHVTVLDTFKTSWRLDELCAALAKVASSTTSFNTVPTKKTTLGENKDIPVKLLRLDAGMSALHTALLDLVEKGAFVFNTPEFVGAGFLPHVTNQGASQVAVGKAYRLSGIALVDMFPRDDPMRRVVIDTFNFNQ